jgi:hypothetical protein
MYVHQANAFIRRRRRRRRRPRRRRRRAWSKMIQEAWTGQWLREEKGWEEKGWVWGVVAAWDKGS